MLSATALRRAWPASIATATVLALASCGSGGTTDADRTDLTVGITPSLTFAQVQYAEQNGLFEKHGLNVEVVEKGSSDVPPLLADEYQVSTMAGATYIQAVAEGFGLRALYPGVDGHSGAIGIMAMPDSGIDSIDDLAGRTVAVNQPGAAFEIFTRILLDDAGVDADDVSFSVIPFSAMVEALVRGQVDAAVLTAPFNTIAENQGAVLAVDPFTGPLDGTPIAGFTITEEFAANNPNTITAFVAAMDEAVAAVNAMSQEEFAAFLPSFTSISEEVALQVVKPEFPTRVDTPRLQLLADRMNEIGAIREATDLAPTVVSVNP
ncbi:ABC transporter substrate-binding protein [Pseudonocardia nematodicida]|uniref:ABC transporter substrate-binding protein n=1 Tax=Pseudonocardia nematodicida TaxID=1206997 RepID=A0ABV1KEC2_9PSEU